MRWALHQDGEVFEGRSAVKGEVEQLALVRQTLVEEVAVLLLVHTLLQLPHFFILCHDIEPLRPFFS